jgi:hypothetical protein
MLRHRSEVSLIWIRVSVARTERCITSNGIARSIARPWVAKVTRP